MEAGRWLQSKKFTLAAWSLVILPGLLWAGKLDVATFQQLYLWIFVTYTTGNVLQAGIPGKSP